MFKGESTALHCPALSGTFFAPHFEVAQDTQLANFAKAMHKLRPKDFGLKCTSSFQVAKPFNYGFIEAFVKTALKEFGNFGIGANNFSRSPPGDGLFGYLVSFVLFNGNASYILNRDGLVITLANGQSKTDLSLIQDLLRRGLRCIQGEELSHEMMAFCHGEFIGGGNPEEILRNIIPSSGSSKPTALSVMSNEPTETNLPDKDRVWLEIAPSTIRENHLFIAWHFGTQGAITEEFWHALAPRADNVARSIGIEVVSLEA